MRNERCSSTQTDDLSSAGVIGKHGNNPQAMAKQEELSGGDRWQRRRRWKTMRPCARHSHTLKKNHHLSKSDLEFSQGDSTARAQRRAEHPEVVRHRPSNHQGPVVCSCCCCCCYGAGIESHYLEPAPSTPPPSFATDIRLTCRSCVANPMSKPFKTELNGCRCSRARAAPGSDAWYTKVDERMDATRRLWLLSDKATRQQKTEASLKAEARARGRKAEQSRKLSHAQSDWRSDSSADTFTSVSTRH